MRYLNRSGTWPSGNPRLYYRPRGQKAVAMPDAPMDSAIFRKAYSAAEGSQPTETGTLSDAISRFSRSPEFAARAADTRQAWARMMDDLRRRYGDLHFADIRMRHIKADLSRYEPHAANKRLAVWKALFRWMEYIGAVEIDHATLIRKRHVLKTAGWTAWTRDDFAAFRAHWPVDSPQRLAFEVYYRTCAATVDALALGPGMVTDGWLSYQRSKTGAFAVVPWSAQNAPDWFEWRDDLEACMAHNRHMTFIVTQSGRPRNAKSASQWFSAACRAAGLSLSAHGIRKGRAAVFREGGASEDQRMAVLGHETQEEATAYSRSADLRRVVEGQRANVRKMR